MEEEKEGPQKSNQSIDPLDIKPELSEEYYGESDRNTTGRGFIGSPLKSPAKEPKQEQEANLVKEVCYVDQKQKLLEDVLEIEDLPIFKQKYLEMK